MSISLSLRAGSVTRPPVERTQRRYRDSSPTSPYPNVNAVIAAFLTRKFTCSGNSNFLPIAHTLQRAKVAAQRFGLDVPLYDRVVLENRGCNSGPDQYGVHRHRMMRPSPPRMCARRATLRTR